MKSDNESFFKLRKVLHALGSSDEIVTEIIEIVDCTKNLMKHPDCKKYIDIKHVAKKIDINEFKNAIISKVFSKEGTLENRAKRLLHVENKKRYKNGDELIDTKEKCLEFLKENGNLIPDNNIQNWVEYCLGRELYLEIRKKYYNTDELVKVCIDNGFTDFPKYKAMYNTDPKLPSPEYLNDGFYCYKGRTFIFDMFFNSDKKVRKRFEKK
jgi:hypothetical protein